MEFYSPRYTLCIQQVLAKTAAQVKDAGSAALMAANRSAPVNAGAAAAAGAGAAFNPNPPKPNSCTIA